MSNNWMFFAILGFGEYLNLWVELSITIHVLKLDSIYVDLLSLRCENPVISFKVFDTTSKIQTEKL